MSPDYKYRVIWTDEWAGSIGIFRKAKPGCWVVSFCVKERSDLEGAKRLQIKAYRV